MYNNLKIFINKAQERIFNDYLMNLAVLEIQLKSKTLNETMILPRYYNKSIIYNGVVYERSAMIKDLVPKKALEELKKLILSGSAIVFKNKVEIKNWIVSQTGITDCSLSTVL